MRYAMKLCLVITIAASTFLPSRAAYSYRRVKLGPFEVVPSLAVDLRQHSNVYLASDDQPQREVSGLLLDIRPGLNLVFRPKLEKQIRGLYVDAKYSPAIALFPSAPEICFGDNSCGLRRSTPDKFKLDHNFFASARYQASNRLTFSASGEYTRPELSRADISLEDLSYGGGVKYDIARHLSLEGTYRHTRFRTPVERVVAGNIIEEDTVFGTFDQDAMGANLSWQFGQSLWIGAHYEHRKRVFDEPLLNDFNLDGIADSNKDFEQDSVEGSISKLITRQTRGTIRGGYVFRDQGVRNFGAKDYSHWIGSATLETLLTKRTRVQASAEYVITDTVRRLSFEDINSFTNDQIGQFSVLPEQFSSAESRRLILDLVQNVFQRGDQLIFGVAFQKDTLLDQFGSQNFFIPGSPEKREGEFLQPGVCVIPGTDPANPSAGAQYCNTVLADQEQELFLVSLGYRMRVLRWLGLQAKTAYFDGTTTPLLKTDFGSNVPIHSSYWNFAAGVVINLQVFQ